MSEARLSDPYLDAMLSRGASATRYWRAWVTFDDESPMGRILVWEYAPDDIHAAGW